MKDAKSYRVSPNITSVLLYQNQDFSANLSHISMYKFLFEYLLSAVLLGIDPGVELPGRRLQSMGSHRVRHD